jgi:quercetin dioxygenase-like cupin family protein
LPIDASDTNVLYCERRFICAEVRRRNAAEIQERGIVLSGALAVEFEHETFTLASGDSLYFPSTRPHRIRYCADGPTSAIWIITPTSF